MHRILLSLAFICFTAQAYSQQSDMVLPKPAAASMRYYISEVIDGRKEENNGTLPGESGKRIPAKFKDGIAKQLKDFTAALLPFDESLLPVILRVKKITLSDKASGNSRVWKAEVSLEFLRNNNGALITLMELSTWMEQGGAKTASGIQESNISEIVKRMTKQFNDQLIANANNPIYAARVTFKVISKITGSENDTIYWSPTRKLTWDDFKGSPNNDNFAAQSNCAFGQAIDPVVEANIGVIYINIRAAFLKNGSWVRKDQDTPEILQHEQLHFDIAEWQIRKLRKAISEASLNFENYEATVNKLCNSAWAEYSAMQVKYDNETKHGTVAEEQKKWTALVEGGLKEYSAFE